MNGQGMLSFGLVKMSDKELESPGGSPAEGGKHTKSPAGGTFSQGRLKKGGGKPAQGSFDPKRCPLEEETC